MERPPRLHCGRSHTGRCAVRSADRPGGIQHGALRSMAALLSGAGRAQGHRVVGLQGTSCNPLTCTTRCPNGGRRRQPSSYGPRGGHGPPGSRISYCASLMRWPLQGPPRSTSGGRATGSWCTVSRSTDWNGYRSPDRLPFACISSARAAVSAGRTVGLWVRSRQFCVPGGSFAIPRQVIPGI